MSTDEQQIREVVNSWLEATKAGDVEGVLKLMADDVVFLAPGQPPMRKADFAAAAASQGREGGPQIDGTSEIQEIKVLGDWAFLWTRLTVTVTPPNGAAPVVRSGHTLSILQKQDGRWLLGRDANLLTVAGS